MFQPLKIAAAAALVATLNGCGTVPQLEGRGAAEAPFAADAATCDRGNIMREQSLKIATAGALALFDDCMRSKGYAEK